MHTKPSDLVLEIGSGNSPRPRSDIIADRLVHDDSQRAGRFTIVIDRPFVIADGYRLPFKNKTFDYVICSHVLEHMEDPKAFVREIMRVGKAGYIEVPDIYGERLFGWDFHLWYCEFKNQTLVMTKKKTGERFGGFFHRLIANHIWFRRFCEIYENRFYIKYEWRDKISLQVIEKSTNLEGLEEKTDRQIWKLMEHIEWNWRKDLVFYILWFVKRVKRKTLKIEKRFIWEYKKRFKKKKIMGQLLPYLLCPTCKNKNLDYNNDVLCPACKARYKVDGVIPVMLTREEAKKGY